MEQIKKVLAHWNITDFSVAEHYHEETERILCRIETPEKAYFLRGVPQEKGRKPFGVTYWRTRIWETVTALRL